MVRIIAGLMGSSVASGSARMATPAQLTPILDFLRKHEIKELDTARVYNSGKSEELLGQLPQVREQFEVETKAPGFSPGSLSKEAVRKNANASLTALKQEKIDLYYFHGPDRQTPLEESCEAINQLHQEGKIVRFGLSNFNRDEVEQIHSICKSRNWLLPTVYQGGFNPLARTAETELFPTLRRLEMSFYAYSPLAGGFFSRPAEELSIPPAGGRMDQMKHFQAMYVNDLTLQLHRKLSEACEQSGLTLKESTLIWLMYHSALGSEDGLVLGASSLSQMQENVTACERGPLSESLVVAFEHLWADYQKGGFNPPHCV